MRPIIALEFENLARDDGRDLGTVARRSSTSWTLTRARPHRPFERHLRPKPGLWRDLRDGAHPRRLPARAARAQSHLQCRRDRRRHAGGDRRRRACGSPRRARPTSSPRQRHRPRRPAHAHRRAGCARPRRHAGDRRPAPARTPRPSWSSPRTAIRRWRRREGNRALLARLNEVNRDLGLPEMAEYDPARRGAADSGFVAADVDTLGGLGVGRRRRPCRGRMGRSRQPAPPGDPRRHPDHPADPRSRARRASPSPGS